MNRNRTLFATACLATATLGLSMLAAAAPTSQYSTTKGQSDKAAKQSDKMTDKAMTAVVGKPAPAFTLKDLDGKSHSLSDFKGKTVVIEWFCPQCPYSGKASGQSAHSTGQVNSLVKDLKKMDDSVVYLLIDSSGKLMSEADLIETNRELKQSLAIPAPILIDHAGTVGKAYQAKTTPHMFVIDGEGILRYDGAFCDRGEMNYVMNAVKAIKTGSTVSPEKTRPWGCSVKYKG